MWAPLKAPVVVDGSDKKKIIVRSRDVEVRIQVTQDQFAQWLTDLEAVMKERNLAKKLKRESKMLEASGQTEGDGEKGNSKPRTGTGALAPSAMRQLLSFEKRSAHDIVTALESTQELDPPEVIKKQKNHIEVDAVRELANFTARAALQKLYNETFGALKESKIAVPPEVAATIPAKKKRMSVFGQGDKVG